VLWLVNLGGVAGLGLVGLGLVGLVLVGCTSAAAPEQSTTGADANALLSPACDWLTTEILSEQLGKRPWRPEAFLPEQMAGSGIAANCNWFAGERGESTFVTVNLSTAAARLAAKQTRADVFALMRNTFRTEAEVPGLGEEAYAAWEPRDDGGDGAAVFRINDDVYSVIVTDTDGVTPDLAKIIALARWVEAAVITSPG
jgi:hypothetical protein